MDEEGSHNVEHQLWLIMVSDEEIPHLEPVILTEHFRERSLEDRPGIETRSEAMRSQIGDKRRGFLLHNLLNSGENMDGLGGVELEPKLGELGEDGHQQLKANEVVALGQLHEWKHKHRKPLYMPE